MNAAQNPEADRTTLEGSRFGRLLYFFAAWTLLIKYVLPVAWALSRKEPLSAYIFFWDAWWLAHLGVGWGLCRRRKVWLWALFLSLAEIAIIGVKFVRFIRTPDLDFWHANWFVNKLFLLVYFIVLLGWLLKKKVRSFYA